MKPMPQIDGKTGVSGDYFNEYMGIMVDYDLHHLEKIPDVVRRYTVKRYQERYPSTKYADVVTDQNRQRVQRLDEIADYVNAQFVDARNVTEDNVRRILNEVLFLIQGEGHYQR